MTVAELRGRMTGEEFVYWAVYHARKAQREELELQRAKGV